MTREQELAFAILSSQNGWHKARIHEARTEIRNLIEQQAKEIEALQSVSKEMARTGMQLRTDLAEAKMKNIEQAKVEHQAKHIAGLENRTKCAECTKREHELDGVYSVLRTEREAYKQQAKQIRNLTDQRIADYDRGYRQGREELQDSMRELLGIKDSPT